MNHRPALLILLALGAAAAVAQSPPDAGMARDLEDAELAEVVVGGRRMPGAVIGDIPPETSLSSQEIRALGVGSVTELIGALGPQLGSSGGRGGGRPVVLVNGVRVSGFAEVRDLPTEAIQRVDIFPEEVALKYGYRADQRVMNIVLRPRFRSITSDLALRGATEGGRAGAGAGAGALRVQRNARWQVDLKARHDDELAESERQVVGPGGAPRADAAYRSLLPAVDQWSANFVFAKPFGENLAATVNATIDGARRRSTLGLPPLIAEPQPLRRDVDSLDSHLGGLLQGAVAGWRWSATLNADRADTATRAAGGDLAGRTRNDSLALELVANGSLLRMPAGDLGVTVKGGIGTRGVESVARRVTGRVSTGLERDERDLRVNLDVPLLRPGQAGGNRVSFSVGHALEHVGEVGTLSTTTLGLNGSLGRKWRALVSLVEDGNAPSMTQLGAAVIPTPGVSTFDFTRGEAAEVVRIDGGNPALSPERRRILKVSLGARPLEDVDLDLNAEFTRSRVRDFVATLSFATPGTERAFPDRFLRDPSGRLLSIDSRPVNFSGRDRDELRLTVNLSRPWGPQPEPPGRALRGGRPAGGPPQGGARSPGAPRTADPAAMAGRFLSFARRGSAQFSLVYTTRLRDEARIAPGLPGIDLLDGDALLDPDGSPRHELELQAGANRSGLGGRLVARWRDGSRIAGSMSPTGPADLEFEPLLTVDLRLFAELGLQTWALDKPYLRGVRMGFAVENLFEERPQLRSADGVVPLSYQPALLDPQGRVVRLSVRKLFFPSSSRRG